MKKNIFILLIFALSSVVTWAQVAIGTGTPDSSAQLDIQSTEKGVLIPKLVKTQMHTLIVNSKHPTNATYSDIEGLMVYCTDCNPKGLYVQIDGKFISLIEGGEEVSYQSFNKTIFPWDKNYVRLTIVNSPKYLAEHVNMHFEKSMP